MTQPLEPTDPVPDNVRVAARAIIDAVTSLSRPLSLVTMTITTTGLVLEAAHAFKRAHPKATTAEAIKSVRDQWVANFDALLDAQASDPETMAVFDAGAPTCAACGDYPPEYGPHCGTCAQRFADEQRAEQAYARDEADAAAQAEYGRGW